MNFFLKKKHSSKSQATALAITTYGIAAQTHKPFLKVVRRSVAIGTTVTGNNFIYSGIKH